MEAQEHLGKNEQRSKIAFLGFCALPGALQSPGPFVQDPLRSSPKRLWSSQGHPKFSQERPEAPKTHIKSTKLACLKPWKYVYLASRNVKKKVPGRLFYAPGTPRGPSRVATPILKDPPGCQKGPPGAPRDLSKVTQEVPGPPQTTLVNFAPAP